MSGKRYLEAVQGVVDRLGSQLATVEQIGGWVGSSVADGGIVHLFGSGHSHMAAEEPFVRAGTLTSVRAIWPVQQTDRFERVEGLGQAVLGLDDVRPGEVLIVISNSGINPLPVDVGLAAGSLGARVVGVGSLAHSRSSDSRHSGGKRLFEVCEAFLDTGVPVGDAMVEMRGAPTPVGPGSTVASVALIQAVMVEATAWLTAEGVEPPLRISRNLPGGDARNDALSKRYADRIPEVRWGR